MAEIKTENVAFTWSFLAPTLLILGIFMIYPAIFTFYVSLNEWDGFGDMRFVGLDNYRYLIHWDTFRLAFRNNLLWVVIMVPLVVILGFLLALFLRRNVIGGTMIKSIIFLGMVIPQTVAAIVFLFIYDPYVGIVNYVLMALHITDRPVAWIGKPDIAIYVLIISSIWIWLGFTVTVYSAAIENIPPELLEAAEIDGLSTFQKIRWIIWPMVKPATTVAIIMSVVWVLKIFDILYVLGGEGGPPAGTDVLAYRMYIEAFVAFRFGTASAIAVILAIMIFSLTIIMFRRLLRGE